VTSSVTALKASVWQKLNVYEIISVENQKEMEIKEMFTRI